MVKNLQLAKAQFVYFSGLLDKLFILHFNSLKLFQFYALLHI